MNIFIVMAALMSVAASATKNDTEPRYGRFPAVEVNIETGSGLVAAVDSVISAPIVLAPSIGSPDEPEHYLELDLIIAHAEFGLNLYWRFAQVNKRSYEHVRGRIPDVWRHEIRMPSSAADFLQTLRQLFALPAVVLSDIFTDEVAALFLSRFQMAALYSPDAVLDLFTKSGIGRIPSVGGLIPGWVVSIAVSELLHTGEISQRETLGNIMKLVPEGDGLSPSASIPEKILQEIQQHINNSRSNEILADLPGRFGEIDFGHRLHTGECVSNFIAEPLFRSRLNLVKDFYFLGVPFFLQVLDLFEIKIFELLRILPFVTGAAHALAWDIKVLIRMGRFDVITAIIKCENFRFGDELCIHQIILALIDSEGQHGLLRALLQTPFRDGVLQDAASITYPDLILHKAVRARNAAAVHELLSVNGLINLNLLDNFDLTARSYAVEGSEIAILLG